MKVGSLFSGGGLGDFGFVMAGFEISWQVEIDEYCQKILALRYPESKKYRDIKTLKGEELEPVDIITGGFPCQPFSVAGLQLSEEDDRNLWPFMFSIIQTVGPRWIVGENVPGVEEYLCSEIIPSLESAGYWNYRDKYGNKKIAPIIIPSSAFGAGHRRDRVWIISHTDGDLLQRTPKGYIEDVSIFEKASIKIYPYFDEPQFKRLGMFNGIRKGDGVTKSMERFKLLGNGQTPCSTYVIGKFIEEIENDFPNHP